MIEFLIYHGKTAVLLAVFYMFYRLLLSKETFHRLNRIVLLGTAVLSFILPCCVITLHKVVNLSEVQSEFHILDEAGMATSALVTDTAEPIWPYAVCAIFILGTLIVLSSTVLSIVKVMGIVRSGEHKVLDSGETLVITEGDIDPFSWMKYIVISKEDYENASFQILTHEKAHIAQKHSWDILLLNFICAIQWFNPAIWMLKADMREIHEFEADDVVLKSGANVKEYQYLLIKKAVGKSGYSVANSFNHSTLKQRITMMSNKKSSRMSAWKALYVIPLVGISLAATAETKVDYHYADLQSRAVTDTLKVKDNEKSSPLYIQRTLWGEEKQITKAELDNIDQNRIESVEVLKNSAAKEKYGQKAENGAVVITIKMPNEMDELKVISYVDNPDNTIVKFYIVEPDTKASFNGEGLEGFSKWLLSNIVRPKGCEHEGTMKVSFVIGTNGKVTDVKILESVCEELDNKVVSVIKNSPAWEPAKLNGKPVEWALRIPIVFELRSK